MANVFLALPHYNNIAAQAFPGLACASLTGAVQTVNLEGGSLLALVFNRLWVRALNDRGRGYSHFAMHHADIQAPPGWVDVLLEEMDKHGADVISAVVAIKDYRGLTSTGYRDPNLGRITRLTIKEVNQLPETFSLEDVARKWPDKKLTPDHWLMVNTGLWLCRFTESWVEQACFSIEDAIGRDERGWFARCLPEDWNFSGFCARLGLKVLATRKPRVLHHGDSGFPNDGRWGEWETDQGD
jgi:hypothetical protein